MTLRRVCFWWRVSREFYQREGFCSISRGFRDNVSRNHTEGNTWELSLYHTQGKQILEFTNHLRRFARLAAVRISANALRNPCWCCTGVRCSVLSVFSGSWAKIRNLIQYTRFPCGVEKNEAAEVIGSPRALYWKSEKNSRWETYSCLDDGRSSDGFRRERK